MAKFEMQLPDDIIKDFQKIYNNSDEIFGKNGTSRSRSCL